MKLKRISHPMRDLSIYPVFKKVLSIGGYEEDKEFRKLLRSNAQNGLFLYGLLATIIITVYVLAHVLIEGNRMTFSLSGVNPKTDIWMVDKLLIFGMGLVLIALSRFSFSLGRIRMVVLLLFWLGCMGMVSDDIVNHDTSFTTAYATIALILAVVAVPYKGWHMALFTLCVVISNLIAVELGAYIQSDPGIELNASQIIYISAVAVLITGISSQIYINRYRQFEAKRRVEDLMERLKERAHVLERLKEESDLQAEKIREHEKLKDRFFANISHEFRNPLTLLMGPLRDLLESSEESDRIRISMQTLSRMERNGQQLLELINQLLDLSKIDAGAITLHRQPVDLCALVEETVRSFAPMAESRKIDLDCDFEDHALNALADPEQLQRAVSNLVSNAIKFTPESGNVTVSVARVETSDNSLEIRVSDTGTGIPAEDLPHVFDRFYQAEHSRGTGERGTGIGLALVKEIVELHGGTVHVNSEPGEGSEFIINLYDVAEESETELKLRKDGASDEGGVPELEPVPVADDENERRESENGAPADAGTLLLVDDNPDILAWLQPHLSSHYHVIALQQSSDAFEIIREKKPDLVISDVMMPEPDGFELCRAVKEDPEINHIPVILMTARSEETHRLEGLELGADDYITKPFSASELLARVENLIELRRLLREKFSEQVRLKGSKAEVKSADARFLQRVQSVIEEQMENNNFGVDWLAGEVNLSTRQLQRKMRSITGLSAGGYIRMMRLERASQLLNQKWGNISEISYKVGFQDAKYFSRLFKQTFGVNPSEYTGTEKTAE